MHVGVHIQGLSDVNELRGFRAFTILEEDMVHYHSLAQWSEQPMITLRPYHKDVMSHNPRVWARMCVAMVHRCYQAGFTRENVRLKMANELNLAIEHALEQNFAWDSEEGYKRINDWLEIAISEVQHIDSMIIVDFPPWSPGHNEDLPVQGLDGRWWYGYDICRDIIEICDGIQVHAYWLPDGLDWGPGDFWYGLRPIRPVGMKDVRDPGGVFNIFPAHQMILSEFNRNLAEGDYMDYSTEMEWVLKILGGFEVGPDGVEAKKNQLIAATHFLYETPYDHHKAFAIRDTSAVTKLKTLADELKGGESNMATIEIPDEIVDLVREDLKEVLEHPDVYGAWRGATGHLNSGCVQFVKATARMPVSIEDLEGLVVTGGGDLNEMLAIAKRLIESPQS